VGAWGGDGPRQSVSDAAKRSGLDGATARRCLLTLHALGYADYDGKYFTLTPRVLRLGVGALTALQLPQIVQPWLDQLSEQIGQSTSVAILDQSEIIYVARAAQRRVMSIGLNPGSRLPAHCTSMGRVLLAALPRADARARVEASDLSPRTRFSLTEPDAILDRVAAAAADGYALVDQEVEIGLRSLAIGLVNARGETVGALNIGVAALQDDPEALIAEYLPALRRVRQGVERILT